MFDQATYLRQPYERAKREKEWIKGKLKSVTEEIKELKIENDDLKLQQTENRSVSTLSNRHYNDDIRTYWDLFYFYYLLMILPTTSNEMVNSIEYLSILLYSKDWWAMIYPNLKHFETFLENYKVVIFNNTIHIYPMCTCLSQSQSLFCSDISPLFTYLSLLPPSLPKHRISQYSPLQ
jgi:hypothetical protein